MIHAAKLLKNSLKKSLRPINSVKFPSFMRLEMKNREKKFMILYDFGLVFSVKILTCKFLTSIFNRLKMNGVE